jgi:hypothetical protein
MAACSSRESLGLIAEAKKGKVKTLPFIYHIPVMRYFKNNGRTANIEQYIIPIHRPRIPKQIPTTYP